MKVLVPSGSAAIAHSSRVVTRMVSPSFTPAPTPDGSSGIGCRSRAGLCRSCGVDSGTSTCLHRWLWRSGSPSARRRRPGIGALVLFGDDRRPEADRHVALEHVDLVVTYSEGGTDVTPATVDDVVDAAAGWWEAFWLHGAAVDFSRCSDPGAVAELERRVRTVAVPHRGPLCRFRTAPGNGPRHQLLGGKFHLEMHWWHAAHFVQWGRPELLRHSLSWYEVILPVAQATARRQGYEGARWPKQVGPDGR